MQSKHICESNHQLVRNYMHAIYNRRGLDAHLFELSPYHYEVRSNRSRIDYSLHSLFGTN